MPPYASGPEESRPLPDRPAEPTPARANSAELRALQDVLAESIARVSDDDQLRLESLAPLLDVARRYRGRPFQPAPVGIALVQRTLAEFYQAHDPDRAAAWHAIAERIGVSLCEHPAVRTRLEQLWSALQERVAATDRAGDR
jgi:hypothetical protein